MEEFKLAAEMMQKARKISERLSDVGCFGGRTATQNSDKKRVVPHVTPFSAKRVREDAPQQLPPTQQQRVSLPSGVDPLLQPPQIPVNNCDATEDDVTVKEEHSDDELPNAFHRDYIPSLEDWEMIYRRELGDMEGLCDVKTMYPCKVSGLECYRMRVTGVKWAMEKLDTQSSDMRYRAVAYGTTPVRQAPSRIQGFFPVRKYGEEGAFEMSAAKRIKKE